MHPYFNLSGDSETSPLDHLLEIHSTQFLPVSTTKIPIGELRKVENSPFDFRKSHKVGSQIEAADEQLEITGGYDHCSVGDDTSSRNRVSAILWDSASGRELGGESNAPGIQLYTGNHLSRATKGKEDRTFVKHGTVCLEPQHIPNAPNEPAFPSALLSIGEQYEHQIAYRFSIRD